MSFSHAIWMDALRKADISKTYVFKIISTKYLVYITTYWWKKSSFYLHFLFSLSFLFSALNELVMDYFVIEGYEAAARNFQQESGTNRKSVVLLVFFFFFFSFLFTSIFCFCFYKLSIRSILFFSISVYFKSLLIV